MRRRVDWETIEEQMLAPWACRTARAQRVYDEGEHDYRSAYQRDRDRIVHCTAFRRLEYKTQVFLNHEGDYYRTRLTHTLEVAQIARTMARALRLNEDLVEAIALAHDLGHGPFGHSSEDELRVLMDGRGGFDHNLQGLRVVDVLERRYADFPGLNLTCDVREGFLKKQIRNGATGITPAPNIHLEGQLVAHADHIAYDNHDTDDGIESGLIDQQALAEHSRLWADALQQVDRESPGLQDDRRRRSAVRRMIGRMVGDSLQQTERNIAAAGIANSQDAREHEQPLVGYSPEMTELVAELEAYLHAHFYRHHRINRVMRKSRRFVRLLFEEYVAQPESLLNPNWLRLLREEQDMRGTDPETACRRIACDYIAGMTDRYVQSQYQRLFLPFEKM